MLRRYAARPLACHNRRGNAARPFCVSAASGACGQKSDQSPRRPEARPPSIFARSELAPPTHSRTQIMRQARFTPRTSTGTPKPMAETNGFAGPTNSLTLGRDATHITPGNVSITSPSGSGKALASFASWAICNSSGSNTTLYLPIAWVTPDGARSCVLHKCRSHSSQRAADSELY